MKFSKPLKALTALLFWAAVWFIAAKAVGQDLILPGPAIVVKTLCQLSMDGAFWQAAFISLARIFGGFVIGAVLGTLLAALTVNSQILDAILSPALKVIRAIPVASFIILVLLWISRSYVPTVVSALIVVPVVWQTTCTAIMETDADLLEMARAYSFGRVKTLNYVYIPSVLPMWKSAAVTTMGLAWKSGVAAEVLCLPKLAIGTQLYYSKIYLETPSLFAWTVVVILLSFILEWVFKLLMKGREKV